MSDIPAPETPFGSAADPFATAKASAMKAAEELRAAAAAKAQEIRQAAEQRAQQFKDVAEEKAGQFREYADKTWTDARKDVGDVTEELKKFTREKPLEALLAAAGVGLLLGLIVRR
jgi:ElaB/YqjD/DUF883 family membrane-anchored ribosome-binding protein